MTTETQEEPPAETLAETTTETVGTADDTADETSAPAGPYCGSACGSLTVAVPALFLPPPLQIFAAIVAIVVALVARRELKANSALRGTWVSLIAFLIGAVVLAVTVWPFVLEFLLRIGSVLGG